jgi:uncharacterized protein YneF (UPF0154 family)
LNGSINKSVNYLNKGGVKMKKILLLLLTVVLATGWGGVVFISEEIEKGKKAGEHVIYMLEDRLKSDDIRAGVLKTSVIFLPEEGKVYVIDHEQKTYTVITKDYVDSVREYMRQMRRQMEEQLAQLPPEQREAMRRMMEQQMGKLPQVKESKVLLVKRGVNLNGWKCDLYRESIDAVLVRESCVVPASRLGIERELFNIIKAFDSFMEGIAKEKVGKLLDKGVPVVEIFYEDGSEVSRTVLKKVERRNIDAEVFRVPAGYKLKTLQIPGG